MESTESFQIPLDVAESYESKFVPAIFAEWAARAIDAVGAAAGESLLDIGCGTGVVARLAARRLGADRVVGVDLNSAMLTVARRIAPTIDWRQGDAAALPVDDDSFDAAVCQMAMMFMPDRRAVFAEISRALVAGGRVVVVVPDELDAQPAYREFVEIAVSRVGDDARSLLSTYWNCGDLDALAADAAAAGLVVVERSTVAGLARFESAHDFVTTEIGSSPLNDRISASDVRRVSTETERRLRRYDTGAGFDIPLHCHVLVARRPT